MNMQQLVAQAQKMQKDILAKKEVIDKKEFIGKSEWIEVVFKGNKEMISLIITNDDAFNKDNKDILSDMIIIAVKEAMDKIDKETNEQLGAYGQMSGLM